MQVLLQQSKQHQDLNKNRKHVPCNTQRNAHFISSIHISSDFFSKSFTYLLIRKTTKNTLTQCIMTNSCFYTLSCAKPCFCSTHNAAGLLRGRVTACLFQFSAFENREAKKEELSQIDFGNEYELSSFPTQLKQAMCRSNKYP